jgi:hypothetical protein
MSAKMGEIECNELASEEPYNTDSRANRNVTIGNVKTSTSTTPFRTNLAALVRERQNGFHSEIAMPTFIEMV